MGRLNRIVIAVLVVGMTATSAYAQTQPRFMASNQAARVTLGSIRGSVNDDRGGPLAGAMVSALGVATAMAVTDARGRFALDALPPGEYVVRVHLAGFLSTRRENIRVGPLPATLDGIQLHRVERAVGTTGTGDVPSRPILAAGLDGSSADDPDSTEDHPHSELAWRLRHLKRSVLKDSGEVVDVDATPDDASTPEVSSSILGSAFSSAASFFSDPPFSGEVNFLTTSAIGSGQQLFTGDLLPRGVAYVSIGAPIAGGEWAVRGSMSQSDLSSWILAGSFSSREAGSH